MITSPANERIKLVRRLASRRQRERLGLFVCEGEDLVQAGIDAGLQPVEALVDGERPVSLNGLAAAEAVAPGLLADVSSLAHPPRIVAVFRRGDLPSFEAALSPPIGLSLWHVADPGNVGTLLRTADALGPAFIALSAGCADPTGPKALRASMGAVFRVPVGPFEAAPRPWVALLPRRGQPLRELHLAGGLTFVLGAERDGLPAGVVAGCDGTASIPLAPLADSLNVAAAGAIALYELAAGAGGRPWSD